MLFRSPADKVEELVVRTRNGGAEVVALLKSGSAFYAPSAAAARMAKAFPQTRFWFAHMGRYNSTDAAMTDQFIRLAEEFDNVWLDLSAVGLPAKIGEAVSRVGAQRLVWGTDGPYRNPTAAEYARAQLDNVRRLDISDEDKRLILGEIGRAHV